MTAPRVYLSIIIPAHNESGRLPAALEKIDRYKWTAPHTMEVLAILNGCADNTEHIARGLKIQYPYFDYVTLPGRGKGLAVRVGMLLARGRWRYMADCDLATPIHCVDDFIAAGLAGADVVIAKRDRTGDGAIRTITGAAYRGLAGLIVPGIQDTQAGFKLFSERAAGIVFPDVKIDGLGFDIEALYLARLAGLRITSLPVPWIHDSDSRVNLFRDPARMFLDLLRVKSLHARRTAQDGRGSVRRVI